MPDANPYCETLPGQLRAWDATSLRCVMECPRKFQLQQNGGWQRRGLNVHLEFGSLYHEATERFDKALLAGATKEQATWDTFTHVASLPGGCLGTSYLPCWRCTSPAEVLGPRSGKLQRNTKRCDMAKSAQLDGHREGESCPDCGLPTTDDWEMIAPDKNKNRNTLLRTVLHYCDTSDDRVVPYKFPDGTPAVELTFVLPLPLESPDGTPYLLTGNLDGMVSFAGETVARERKTTKSTPGSYFFARYAPDPQIDTYDLATYVLYSDLLDPKPHGVMVEVTQVTQNFSLIERQIVSVPEERREEWLRELQVWIKQAEGYAREKFWPKNTASCNANGGCQFRDVCKQAPHLRQNLLEHGEKYERREKRWNPLEVR